MYNPLIKRSIDLCASFVGIVILLPIILLLILLLLFANNGKPFFLQPRPGKDGELFNIIKFKTMKDIKAGDTINVHSTARVTKIGAFIRKYSLDELMQLFNVLKGDMSLVGPRPLLVEYLPLYNKEQQLRHSVRPGITGWAQVRGRNAISWAEKFKYDIWYVRNISFPLDLKIFFLTLLKVFKKEGVNKGEDETMSVWRGNNAE